MPCRDYETDWASNGYGRSVNEKKLKQQADRLASLACAVMTAYENGVPYSDVIKDYEINKWWKSHKLADEKNRKVLEKAKNKEAEAIKLRNDALAKLTPEEIEAFGLGKKGRKK